MKILILDTYYPDAIKAIPFDASSTYEVELRKVLDYGFGTADFYSHNLRALGHEVVDVIANHGPLQEMWANENAIESMASTSPMFTALLQIEAFKPDVIFIQDFSFFVPSALAMLSKKHLLTGQLSCPWPGVAKVSRVACVFSSFPHYIKRFDELGLKGVYLPLAFEPRMLEGAQPERDLDISFVGGLGRNSHWLSGTDTLEIVAERFKDRFHWFGYGLDNLPANSALRACYRGPAWGRAMYDIYRRSKIVVNRHGEVAGGFTNNLRCFEATGCGAMLQTEESENIGVLFPYGTTGLYSSPSNLCDQLDEYLKRDDLRTAIATRGQRHTLTHHTYAQRMKVVSDVLQEMLVSA